MVKSVTPGNVETEDFNRELEEYPTIVTGESKAIEMRADGATVSLRPSEVKAMSFAELAEAFQAQPVDSADVIESDSFGPVLDNKDKGKLVGIPFVIVHFEFHPGTFGEFVSLWVLTSKDERYIVNDGSTGIYAQCRKLLDTKGIDSMITCREGLRVSEYEYTDKATGEKRPAKTYYLS